MKDPFVIYRPIKTDAIAQRFGDNRACIDLATRVISYRYAETCLPPTVDFYASMGLAGHNGTDFAAKHGEPVYFSVVGAKTTWWANDASDNSGGIGVDVISRDAIFSGSYVKIRFWHLLKCTVTNGQEVNPGDQIGLADSTGASSADHVHISLKPCDKEGNAIMPQNGYAGCVDFAPWFENRYILYVQHSPNRITWMEFFTNFFSAFRRG